MQWMCAVLSIPFLYFSFFTSQRLCLQKHSSDIYFYALATEGLVVSMLASGTQVYGFKPGRSRWIFTGVKIFSKPSYGGEVKESVPCPSFAACKRT